MNEYGQQNDFSPQNYGEVHYYPPVIFNKKEYDEKKNIRKAATHISVPLIIVMAVLFFWATIYYAVAGVMGFSPTQAYKMVSNPAILQAVQVALSLLLFTIPFSFTVWIAGKRITDTVKLEKPKKGVSFPFLLIGVGFCAFSNIANSNAGGIFESFGIEYEQSANPLPSGVFGFLLCVISTAVVPALVEEFAFRGVAMGFLRKFGEGFSVIVSSILFGLLHGNIKQIPFALLVGLVLGYIYIKTESLWICCAVHGINNLISVIFSYLGETFSVAAQNIMYMFFLIASLVLGLIGLYLLRGKESYYFNEEEKTITEKQKYKWFFTSPLVIVFIIICVFEAVMNFL